MARGNEQMKTEPSQVVESYEPSVDVRGELAQLHGRTLDQQQVSAEALRASPEWNKYITLTFDDSLRNSYEIMTHLLANGVTNFRFYGEAGTAMRPEVLRDMGVVGLVDSRKLTPGKWLTEYVDKKRGNLTREEYMRRYMIKNSPSQGTDYLANGDRIRTFFQKKYPENWLQKLEETFCYHAALIHPHPIDKKNHIQYWSSDQIMEDIETFETFMRAWLNIPEFKVRHLRTPAGGAFGYDGDFNNSWYTGTDNAQKLVSTVDQFRPGAKWDMWTTDSEDALRRGKVDYKGVGQLAVSNIENPTQRQYLPSTNLVLMHSNYYDQDNIWKVDRTISEIGTAFGEKYPWAKEENVVKKAATISVSMAYVRSRPEDGPESKVVAKMKSGERIFVQERAPGLLGWLKITWGKDDRIGYIRDTQAKLDTRKLPAKLPSFEKIRGEMESIDPKYRHVFSQEDRKFIFDTVASSARTMDWSRTQYLVVVDRASQFAALVYYSYKQNQYYIVGDFGTKTSTGKQDVANRTWATPRGVYDRKPLEDIRKAQERPEWRASGTGGGGFGPAGSRIFVLGQVDVNSPYGKPLSVALHKTNRASISKLGEVAASHGCVRTSDDFIDILDRNFLIDGDYGRYVIVGDSAGRSYEGDFNQLTQQQNG